ncbi:MAG: crotonase/enoyl-CoA hydratase family protein [Acidimicrobiia bacterium]
MDEGEREVSEMALNAAGEPIVVTERRGRAGIIRFNRPESRNAVSAELTIAVAEAIDAFEADDDVWVLVITGTGQAFCAGADLKQMGSPSALAPEDRVKLGGFAGISTRRFVKPVIAAVNGFALGGGTEICLSCDLVVAEEHAQFGLPEVKRGIVAGAGGMQRLPRRVPPAIALEMVMTGAPISAARALELGLINRVVPAGEGLDAALALAETISENAPLAVRYSRAVARASFSSGEDDALVGLEAMRDAMFASEDSKEGPRAFAEKRPPKWAGR